MNNTVKLPRIVCWFSAGAPSAVAAKLAIAGATTGQEVVIAYTDPGSEHPDNHRFMADCEEWFGQEVIKLKGDYEDTWDVWERTRFLVGPTGTRCTAELKRKPRFKFERPDDIQVFGYTVEEEHRAIRFREQNPGVTLKCPLIDGGLTKPDCLAMVQRAGIELPEMYRLGYNYNNCVGCVKGGMGYWNKIRVDFPKVFDRMAILERNLQRTVLRSEGQPVFLDELDPKRGNHQTEPDIECSLLCAVAEDTISTSEGKK
jgi:hypothetical protein